MFDRVAIDIVSVSVLALLSADDRSFEYLAVRNREVANDSELPVMGPTNVKRSFMYPQLGASKKT